MVRCSTLNFCRVTIDVEIREKLGKSQGKCTWTKQIRKKSENFKKGKISKKSWSFVCQVFVEDLAENSIQANLVLGLF